MVEMLAVRPELEPGPEGAMGINAPGRAPGG
jgi:hypothetical protein